MLNQFSWFVKNDTRSRKDWNHIVMSWSSILLLSFLFSSYPMSSINTIVGKAEYLFPLLCFDSFNHWIVIIIIDGNIIQPEINPTNILLKIIQLVQQQFIFDFISSFLAFSFFTWFWIPLTDAAYSVFLEKVSFFLLAINLEISSLSFIIRSSSSLFKSVKRDTRRISGQLFPQYEASYEMT